jgi:hypothetical protein
MRTSMSATISTHVYEVRPRKDHRGVDLISDALPFGGLWYCEVSDAIGYLRSTAADMMLAFVLDAQAKN